jgi:hypothetical protein
VVADRDSTKQKRQNNDRMKIFKQSLFDVQQVENWDIQEEFPVHNQPVLCSPDYRIQH